MGIPRVGFSHTIPEPTHTVITHGGYLYRTVNCAETRSIIAHGIFIYWKSLKYILVGFPPVMGSLPNLSFQVIGLQPIMEFAADGWL